MQTLNVILRFVAIFQLVLIAAVLLKGYRRAPAGLLAAAFALSVVCYLLAGPALRYWQWGEWSVLVLVGARASPVLFWLLARALFEDGFRLRWQHLLLLVLFEGVYFGAESLAAREGVPLTTRHMIAALVPRLLVVSFVGLGLAVTIRDWRVDLIETRRRLRLVLLASTGAYMIVIAGAGLILSGSGQPPPATVQTLNAGLILTLAFFLNVSLLNAQSELFGPPHRRAQPLDADAKAEREALEHLQRLMAEERAFTDTDLTIGNLARRLGQQEHKLRRLINRQLRYRNFNDFLNQYRIVEAAKRLTHPDSRHLPVLIIAMDVGYRSLAPFNKAFKQLHGVTPTEYRRAKLAEIGEQADLQVS